MTTTKKKSLQVRMSEMINPSGIHCRRRRWWQQCPRGFTLIELLVVISIIALLIALLLPALKAARESAKAVLCSSTQRQMVIATTLYLGDHRDYFPMGLEFNTASPADSTYWPRHILEYYSGAENAFQCPLRLGDGDFNGYLANGGAGSGGWLFWDSRFGNFDVNNLNIVKSPGKVVLFSEDTEGIFNVNLQTYYSGAQADMSVAFLYFTPASAGINAPVGGGRHFRVGGANSDPWGADNIAFVDGHVLPQVSMQALVEESGNSWFFSYPFTNDSSYLFPGRPSRDSTRPADAEFWRVPWW